MHNERFAGAISGGLPEIIDDIQRRKMEMQEKLFHYNQDPKNQPAPYHPKDNPVLPDRPDGRPGMDTGGWAYNRSQYQNIAGLGNDLGIVGNQIKKGNPFGLVGEALGVKLF